VEAVSARIAHLCILDALMMSLAARKYETLQSRIAERNEVLSQMRYKNK
jgi:DNA-binding MurR/RpiR family transcriptional regulator